MQLVDQTDPRGPSIREVRAGVVVIADREWRESFLIQPGFPVQAWSLPPLAGLTLEHARSLLERQPALVILGCGARQAFPPGVFVAELLRAGVGLETMPNDAAARTFNLLANEGRNVLGAFLLE